MHGTRWIQDHAPALLCYAASLQFLTCCDHVVLTDEMSPEFEALLEPFGLHVIRRPPRTRNSFVYEAHLARMRFLREVGSRYQSVIQTCSRDVIFQADAPALEGLHLVGEGRTYARSEWDTVDMQRFLQRTGHEMPGTLADTPLVNGGQHLGSPDALLDYYERLLPFLADQHRIYTDQAATNWLVATGAVQATIHDPRTSTLCLTAKGVAIDFRRDDRGRYLTAAGEPYCFVHRYSMPEPVQLAEMN
jgi:hypothetical protein